MKHQAWRHEPSAYGSSQPVAARFADVDTRRHVNNIAVYGLHHEARQRWLMAAGGGGGRRSGLPAACGSSRWPAAPSSGKSATTRRR